MISVASAIKIAERCQDLIDRIQPRGAHSEVDVRYVNAHDVSELCTWLRTLMPRTPTMEKGNLL